MKTKEKAIAKVWKEYDIKTDLAWKEYKKIRDLALKEYNKIRDPAWKAYEEKIRKINEGEKLK